MQKGKTIPAVLVMVLTMVMGCSGSSSAPAGASLSGQVQIPGAPTTTTVAFLSWWERFFGGVVFAEKPTTPVMAADFVPGELIVRFQDGTTPEDGVAGLERKFPDDGLTHAGFVYPGGPLLLRTNAYANPAFTREEAKRRTRELAEQVGKEPTIKYAEINYIGHFKAEPNDPAYVDGNLWGLRMVGSPAAWDITTGVSSIVVAVIDSGVHSDHPDLRGNVLSDGFNFQSNNTNTTDDPAENHGTHVAGTIAAVTNNATGVAGVAWQVKLLPIRVGGGDQTILTTQVINAMRYAARLSNSSNRLPAQAARVLNMSLGFNVNCPQAVQETVTEVRNTGAILVAAAGNEFQEGNPTSWPANCTGVIGVGAVNSQGSKAGYSNEHPYVFIAAPGGSLDNGFRREGVLSTLMNQTSGPGAPRGLYKFQDGTSMATPHVAGVVALMLSAKSSLKPNDIENILKETAIRLPLGTAQRNNQFGWGLINAAAAVARAADRTLGAVPIPLQPVVSLQVDRAVSTGQAAATFVNGGSGTVTLSSVSVQGSWLTASLVGNQTQCGGIPQTCAVSIAVNATGLPDGVYEGLVRVSSNGGVIPILVNLRVGEAQQNLGPITIRATKLGSGGALIQAAGEETFTTTTTAAQDYRFTFSSLPPGSYVVQAGIDLDGDGIFGDAPGEAVGTYPLSGEVEAVTLDEGVVRTGIDFPVLPGESVVDESDL